MQREHFFGSEVGKESRLRIANELREARAGTVVVWAGLEKIGGMGEPRVILFGAEQRAHRYVMHDVPVDLRPRANLLGSTVDQPVHLLLAAEPEFFPCE